jgi:hypothetical protein
LGETLSHRVDTNNPFVIQKNAPLAGSMEP